MATYTQQCSQVGSFSYARYFTLYVILNETDIDIINNRSKVNYNIYCQSSGSGSINARHLKYFSINGQEVINTVETVNVSSPNAYIHIAGGTTDYITHNSDGSKIIPFSAKIQASSYGVSAEINNNFELQTIPRASSVACTTANIGETALINIASVNDSFTHNVSATFGGITVNNILSGVKGGTFSWTIPTSFYSQIPNAKSGNGTITCNTYSNGSLIGSSSSTFTVTTNETNCKPLLSATVKDVNSETINLTGDENKLIKYNSTAYVFLSATARNNSSIVSKTVNGKNVIGTNITFPNSEATEFVVTVIDSRGYSTTVTLRPTVINYIPLTVNPTFKRTAPTTGEIDLTFNGNYYNGNFSEFHSNLIQMKYRYKKISGNNINEGKRNLKVGDVLSAGTKLYLEFPENSDFYRQLIDERTVINCGDNAIKELVFGNTYKVSILTSDYQELGILYRYSDTGELIRASIELTSNLGTITSINTSSPCYQYIFFDTWSDEISITPTITGNTITNGNLPISLGTGFNYKEAYYFELRSIDRLTTQKTYQIVTAGVPVYNWGKDFFNVNGEIRINDVPINEIFTIQ